MITLADIADYLPFVQRPAPKYVSPSGARIHGIIAEFEDPPAVYHAAEKCRDAGLKRWDVFTPFPIHGMEEAMGVKRTKLPVHAFMAAMTGIASALILQYFTNSEIFSAIIPNNWDYEFVVQGKPTNAWEAYIPVTFELGILATAFTCIGGMLMLNGLPRWHHPLFSSERFLKVSDNRFIIAVEAADPTFDPDATRRLLQDAGGTHVELIEDED